MVLREDNLIEKGTENKLAHYEPYGWHHWPEHPWLSYQFRRGLGETQEGGGTVSECFQAAARMIPGDKESWHREWMAVAKRNFDHQDGAVEPQFPQAPEPARRGARDPVRGGYHLGRPAWPTWTTKAISTPRGATGRPSSSAPLNQSVGDRAVARGSVWATACVTRRSARSPV